MQCNDNINKGAIPLEVPPANSLALYAARAEKAADNALNKVRNRHKLRLRKRQNP